MSLQSPVQSGTKDLPKGNSNKLKAISVTEERWIAEGEGWIWHLQFIDLQVGRLEDSAISPLESVVCLWTDPLFVCGDWMGLPVASLFFSFFLSFSLSFLFSGGLR